MTLFNFLNRKQCKYTLTVKQNEVIVDEVRCVLDDDHDGLHRDTTGKYVWHHPVDIRRFLEDGK